MFNADKVKEDIVQWIREQMYNNGGQKVIIGISGGKDSSVVAALCVEALGKENVIGVLMPQGDQHDISYSYDLCNHLEITHFVINIQDTVKVLTEQIENSLGELSMSTKLNIPARIRMATLYGVAQTIPKSRVTCNSNLSENYIGFATIYGDTAGAFAPLAMLTTEEVIELGKELGLPKTLVEKAPEDGLLGSTDEDHFGFTYKVLNKYIRTGICEDPIIKEKIDKLHKASKFKLELIPVYKGHYKIQSE